MELIKINPDHYIIVDDSKIEDNDWMQRNNEHPVQAVPNFWWDFGDKYRKVTYSTKPLEDITILVRPDGSDVSKTTFDKVKEISLSEVKELIGEVDMEELELKYHQRLIDRREVAKNFRGQVAGNHPDMFTSREMLSMMQGFTEGYTQALEDTKNKKTIWEVEFIDGELKLI